MSDPPGHVRLFRSALVLLILAVLAAAGVLVDWGDLLGLLGG